MRVIQNMNNSLFIIGIRRRKRKDIEYSYKILIKSFILKIHLGKEEL